MDWLTYDLNRYERQVDAQADRQDSFDAICEELMQEGESCYPYTFEAICEALAELPAKSPHRDLIKDFLLGNLSDGCRIEAYKAIREIAWAYWAKEAETLAEERLMDEEY